MSSRPVPSGCPRRSTCATSGLASTRRTSPTTSSSTRPPDAAVAQVVGGGSAAAATSRGNPRPAATGSGSGRAQQARRRVRARRLAAQVGRRGGDAQELPLQGHPQRRKDRHGEAHLAAAVRARAQLRRFVVALADVALGRASGVRRSPGRPPRRLGGSAARALAGQAAIIDGQRLAGLWPRRTATVRGERSEMDQAPPGAAAHPLGHPTRARFPGLCVLAPYARPHLGRSVLDLATSVVPYLALSVRCACR